MITYQAEDARLAGGAAVSTIRHLGEPDGGSWVRAGNRPGRLTFSLASPPGVYRLVVRGTGEQPLRFEIPSVLLDSVAFKPYLVNLEVGVLHLAESRSLRVEVPPRSGVDFVRLERYRDAPRDFLALIGLAAEDGPAEARHLDALLKLLAALVVSR